MYLQAEDGPKLYKKIQSDNGMALEKIQPRDNSCGSSVNREQNKKNIEKNLYILNTKGLYGIVSIFDSHE